MNHPDSVDQQLHRELTRVFAVAPLDANFDAAVLARIASLPQHAPLATQQPAIFEGGQLQRLLMNERRRLKALVVSYGLGASAVLAVVWAGVASDAFHPARRLLPALDLLPPIGSLAIPIAAAAVLGAGAWMIARDKVSSILSI